VRFYRGSSVPELARLEGFPRFGSPSTAAHLAQDKFASLALASASGLDVPPTLLVAGRARDRCTGPVAERFRTPVRQA
jgi:glutathione synthase/RimK-type ligase-like ATP-grasp enzyme